MKRLFFTTFLLLSFVSLANSQTFYGTPDLKTFREGRENEFRNKTETPLKDEDIAEFKGLHYFPENKKLVVKATFKRTSDEKYFQMPTSSGKSKKFVKYGVLSFKLNGKKQTLNVYQADAEVLKKYPEYADLLFIPFKDLTNGTKTYSGGRYIDLKTPTDNEVTINFNLAYNPNCAYGSDRYNCPIPPKENALQVKIEAGEKIYKYSNEKH